jgi:hypothetical protein
LRLALRVTLLGVALSCLPALADIGNIEASYRFLVSKREGQGGALFTATAGALNGLQLPLSYVDSADYWGDYVCRLPGNDCTVLDVYDPAAHTLVPPRGTPGELQTERVFVHNGANIYDAATWQIAVMLGSVVQRLPGPAPEAAWALASAQNALLAAGHDANAPHFAPGSNRALSTGERFLYNGRAITDPRRAFAYRMPGRRWLADDPFIDTRHAGWISTTALPADNPDYRAGRVSWSDWKPFTGENAWAFLIGPLQAAHIHYVQQRRLAYVPLREPAVQAALQLLPAFASMQAPIGGVHYAPSGTLRNRLDEPVDPREIVVENNVSLYAGLRILEATLHAQLRHERGLAPGDRDAVDHALALIGVMLHGGHNPDAEPTAGLLSFFREHAWRDGEFVQGGLALDPRQGDAWVPTTSPRAVDANTWGVAALGPGTIDGWFGFGAALRNWQQLKRWGGYGEGPTLWGVGYSELDGNGVDGNGAYRAGILSSEWTAGAITMVRGMITHYGRIAPDSPRHAAARRYLEELRRDEQTMLAGIGRLRLDAYIATPFAGKPPDYERLMPRNPALQPYVYASRRYAIPFGWYANPLPSTCATAWVLMLAAGFDPFGYGGAPN